MASLLISVLDRKLAPTVGHILCTLVRLCVDPIDPSRNVSVQVSFDWRYNDYDYDDDIDDDENDHDDRNESGRGGHWSSLLSSSTEDPYPAEEDRDNDIGSRRQQRLC